jgi:hypothetical protein
VGEVETSGELDQALSSLYLTNFLVSKTMTLDENGTAVSTDKRWYSTLQTYCEIQPESSNTGLLADKKKMERIPMKTRRRRMRKRKRKRRKRRRETLVVSEEIVIHLKPSSVVPNDGS